MPPPRATGQISKDRTRRKMGLLDGLFGSEGGGNAGEAGDALGGAASAEPTVGGEAEK